MLIDDIDFKHLIQSLDQIVGPKTKLTKRFYTLLFEEHPKLKPLFQNTERTTLEAHLMDSLIFSIHNLKNPEVLYPALSELGRKHRDYGVQPEHFPVFPTVMIKALKDTCTAWTPYLEAHWQAAIAAMMDIMYRSYARS